jgi:hypothetical protein
MDHVLCLRKAAQSPFRCWHFLLLLEELNFRGFWQLGVLQLDSERFSSRYVNPLVSSYAQLQIIKLKSYMVLKVMLKELGEAWSNINLHYFFPGKRFITSEL